MAREDFVQVLKKMTISQENIDDWVRDKRGPETIQICIICEGLLRFLWFSLRESDLNELWDDPTFSKVVAEDWQNRLKETIRMGDRKLYLFP